MIVNETGDPFKQPIGKVLGFVKKFQRTLILAYHAMIMIDAL